MNRFTSHATRNRRRTAVLSVLASAALAAAACGSDDEGGAGTAAPSAAPTTSSAATPDTTGATDQQTTDSGATTSVDPSRPAGWIPAGDGVKGVTDDEIVIGLSTRDAAATSATAGELSGGVTEEGTPIDKVQAAIIDYINETGGIAGRQVKPVYAFYDITQSNAKADRQRQQQAMCVSWTEDNEVFAMVNTHAATHELWFDCARESETPFLASITVAVPSQEQFDAMSDYWYTPPLMIADHREQAVTSFLLDHGFFEEGAKVGLMIEDTPGIRAGVENGLKPVLDEAGIEIAAEIVYPDYLESPWPNYVLQLQMAGVTHVLMSATHGSVWSTVGMMNAAQDQGYFPKWGVGSDNLPFAFAALGAPNEQIENVMAAGWIPGFDTGDPESQSAAAEECESIMTEIGATPREGDQVCELLFFLRAAFEHAPELSPSGLAEGTAALGDSYQSVMTGGGVTEFGPGRHDGPAEATLLAWSEECTCLAYTDQTGPLFD